MTTFPSATRWVIRNTGGPAGASDGVFWSNDQGWVDLTSATIFTGDDPIDLNLPADGEWVRIEDLRVLIAQMEMAQRAELSKIEKERDEADRRAGAAERKLANLEEQERRRDHWLNEAKVAAGHSTNTSFDQVWAEVLAAAKQAPRPTSEVELTYSVAYEGDHTLSFPNTAAAKEWLETHQSNYDWNLDGVRLRYCVGEIDVYELMKDEGKAA